MTNNPMDEIKRFEVHPDACQEVRDKLGEANLIFAKIKELCELQEKNLELNLMPTLYRLLGRTEQITKELQAMKERTSDE